MSAHTVFGADPVTPRIDAIQLIVTNRSRAVPDVARLTAWTKIRKVVVPAVTVHVVDVQHAAPDTRTGYTSPTNGCLAHVTRMSARTDRVPQDESVFQNVGGRSRKWVSRCVLHSIATLGHRFLSTCGPAFAGTIRTYLRRVRGEFLTAEFARQLDHLGILTPGQANV